MSMLEARSEEMSTSRAAKSSKKRIFIAAPMSGMAGEEYRVARDSIMELQKKVGEDLGLRQVYFAGSNISSASDFTDSFAALKSDLTALRRSDVLMFVYPKPVVTGALVELGVAIERGMPILMLVRKVNDLPYFLRSGNSTALAGLPKMVVATFDEMESLPHSGVAALARLVGFR